MKEFLTITAAVVTAQIIRSVILGAVSVACRPKNFVPVQAQKRRLPWFQAWLHRSLDCY